MGKDVIIACDFASAEDTFKFLDKFTDKKPFVKIGMELFYAEGPQIVREIKARLYQTGFIIAAIIIFLLRKGLDSVLHPIKKVKVQVANIERQDQNINAAARKMSAGFPVSGNRPSTNQMQMSNMAHAMEDNLMFTFYLLDKDNKKIKLKIPSGIGNNMAKVGDIGYVTHQNGIILRFEKTGSVEES